MRPMKPKDAILHRHEVADADRTATYRTTKPAADSSGPQFRNVYLIGLRGSGKTTLARRLGELLNAPVVDTDELIRQRAGKEIAAFVEEQGWQAFRDLESQVLADVAAQEGQIVATGGGIILNAKNRELLAETGTVFYLMAEVPTLLARLQAAPDAASRPPLTKLDPEAELQTSLREREPLYLQTADYYINAAWSIDHLAASVREKLS